MKNDITVKSYFNLECQALELGLLTIITIYNSPTDYPNKFVSRMFVLDKNNRVVRTRYIILGKTLEEVREKAIINRASIETSKLDDDCIVESWI